MSLSPYQFQLLTTSSKDVCDNFEHFFTYFNLLIKKKLPTFIPLSGVFDHKKNICALAAHLTSQQSVWLFIDKHREYLSRLFQDKHQVNIFSDVFLMALSATLKSKLTLAVRKAWQTILFVFTNMVQTQIHGYSNVVSMQHYRTKRNMLTQLDGKLRSDP
ncbi:hypothetical protein [Pseudoalteromonas phenolica]|uniref:Globin n=1 Tax=Pseudoalteromonas phenolica TaxID=161398 RepID=A0A0S2JZW0_9GAMM|nr:hypothetical protein [Pseudoalteromonas phenolica]ALO41545.1 hypothetical protein PP2015_1027 [Pseudoalteromonas phenolica]MBE0353908.1 hypothetical protein [Pseudoalteromonas phenolica O-BC30]